MRLGSGIACLLALASVELGGCAGSSVRKEAKSVAPSDGLASAEDPRVRATIETLILRNNEGAWARDAEWDEYLVRIRSRASMPLEIRGLAIYDALGMRVEPLRDRAALVEGTRDIQRRYEQSGKLTRTTGVNEWVVAGAVVGGSAIAVGATAAPLVAGGAAALAVAVPLALGAGLVFAGAGVKRLMDDALVEEQIQRRVSKLPVTVQPGAEVRLDLFFPVAPLSPRAELVYADGQGVFRLEIETREALAKLEWEAPPTLVSRTTPEFPDAARRMGLSEGYVIAHLTLDSMGRVQDVRTLRSVPSLAFAKEAHRTLRQWTYTEGRNDGRVVEVRLDFRR